MPKKSFPHLFIAQSPEVRDYTSPRSVIVEFKLPQRNRQQHGNVLKRKFQKLWTQIEEERQQNSAVSFPDKKGFYLQFKSKLGFDLITESLENIRGGIHLLNIEEKIKPKQGNQKIVIATVFVPYRKADIFLKKINQYLQEDTKTGKPKNKNLIESIEEIQFAVLESFWQDKKALIPKNDESVECEVWLRIDSKSINRDNTLEQINKFFEVCDILNDNNKNKFKYEKEHIISFPERAVVLIKANKKHLINIIKNSDQIAEFRKAKETARFWLEQANIDQTDWVKDLNNRLLVNKNSQISVCLLDTGVNNGHLLVFPVLEDKDCHTINPQWGVDDKHGHGTAMSGLVIYGDLQTALESKEKIHIHHKLESVKLIPFSGKNNPKKLYGYLTKQGINRVEIEKPNRKRTVCMAVTSTDDRDKGRPSSWSGAIDQISSGVEEEGKKRFLIISAGNVRDAKEWKKYPSSNITNAVHDPAQSWNALTVGAYTDKELIKDPKLKGYKPIAKKEELSPFSTTSCSWETTKWPVKPDIVMEGGNIAKDDNQFTTEAEDLSLLSLHHKPQERQFDMISATSAATAQASWLASQIQCKYKEIWPETIRALIVHSAEWKEGMKKQFWDRDESEKRSYKKMLRIFGYGVPDLNKAIASYQNSLTLISENTLQPFTKKGSSYSTKDMHFYEMPWPKEVLQNLPDETKIQLKFTLSYFVEPGPGEIGWKDKYRYPSHGLRFSLIGPQETKDSFIKRINKAVRDEEESVPSRTDDRWKFGTQNRDLGSIHSDVWEGSAHEIAVCNLMAIYPTIGWWKTRTHLKKFDQKARYSLIVSLSTEEENVAI